MNPSQDGRRRTQKEAVRLRFVDPPDSPEIRLRFEISLGGRREVVGGEAEEETEDATGKQKKQGVGGKT